MNRKLKRKLIKLAYCLAVVALSVVSYNAGYSKGYKEGATPKAVCDQFAPKLCKFVGGEGSEACAKEISQKCQGILNIGAE